MNTVRQKLALLHMSREERRAYEQYIVDLVSTRGMIENAKEEGREEGRSEGREEGINLGKDEERRIVAQKMIAKEMPIPLIAEVTGLSEEEIEKTEPQSS